MRRAAAALALAFAVLTAAGCGGGGDDSAASWDGPPKPAADASVDVSGFTDYAQSVDELWESSPAMAAGEFLRLDQKTATVTTIDARSGPEGTGPTAVTVTLEGLADDSVRSERWLLTFTPVDDSYELSQARWAQRCRPGRGHPAYSAEPCV
jgi:hypothetical protein